MTELLIKWLTLSKPPTIFASCLCLFLIVAVSGSIEHISFPGSCLTAVPSLNESGRYSDILISEENNDRTSDKMVYNSAEHNLQ